MLRRFLLCAVIAGAAAGIGYGQTAADLQLPEPCRTPPSEDLPTLEKRKAALEREIEAARGASDDSSIKSLSRSQEQLLAVVFKLECLKLRAQVAARPPGLITPAPSPKPAPSPAPWTTGAPTIEPSPPPAPDAQPKRGLRKLAPAPQAPAVTETQAQSANAVEVTTYYATNRGQTGMTAPAAKVYDATPSRLSYGRAVVSVPKIHSAGNLELPRIWRLEFQPDPSRHFVLKEAKPLSTDLARTEMARKLAEAKSQSLLVFVHGYNVSFAETAMRTAQLAYDLNFPGLPFFFSWPSAAQYTGYLRDSETAQLSEDAFDQVLDDLAQLAGTEVYIIAHSMGSRIVSQVLKSRVERGKATARVRELLLAAPDINAEIFRTKIAPRLAQMQGTQTTVYASSSDLALIASKAVHGYRRVGETAGGVLVFPGLETIDASRASMAVRAFGHSYLTDSAAVLKDIQSILRLKLPAKQRGLAEAGSSPNVYWALR